MLASETKKHSTKCFHSKNEWSYIAKILSNSEKTSDINALHWMYLTLIITCQFSMNLSCKILLNFLRQFKIYVKKEQSMTSGKKRRRLTFI